MRVVRYIARLIARPFVIMRATIARLRVFAGAVISRRVSVIDAVRGVGKGRAIAAPVWRRLFRAALMTAGFVIYAGMQYGMAGLISKLWWWYIVAFLIIAGSFVLAAASPIAALIAWIVVSPFGRNFLYMDFGWKVLPAITLDFVVVYSLALLQVVRALLNRHKPRGLMAGEWLMLGFVAYVVATVVFESSLSEIPRIISRRIIPDVAVIAVLYFTCKATIQKREHIVWMVVASSVFGLLMALAAFYEHYSGNRWYSPILGFGIPLTWGDVGKGRASGVFEHVAAPATLVATSLFLTYYLALWTKRSGARVFYIACMFPMIIGAFFTYTRNVYIAVVLFAVMVPLMAVGKRKQFAGLSIAGLLCIMAVAPRLLLDPTFATRMLSKDNVYARITYAKTALNVITHNPWFGVGYGRLNEVQREYVATYAHWQRTPGRLGNPNISHNTYLTLIAEEGAVGSVAYLGAILAFLVRLVRIRGNLPDDEFLGKDFVSMMIISSIIFLISISAASIYLVPYVNFVFWMQFAMVIRLDELRRDEETARSLSPGDALPLGEAAAA